MSKCLCVLGMHRSGTSCLTGIMQGIGVELGEVFTENLFNKRGNRENDRIVHLNHAVLAYNQGDWNKPVVATSWTAQHVRERDAIIGELSGRSGGYWGFKDPRTLFTIDFWLEAIDEPGFIGTFRHPQRVALSLHSRDETPLEKGWDLWFAYNQRLLELADQYHFALVDFDGEPVAYLDEVIDALTAMGLNKNLAARGREFFDPALRNQAASDVESIELPDKISSLYDQLRDYRQTYMR